MSNITVKNFRRSRKWGWGWSITPTGEDAYAIETPGNPDYVGTLNQIARAKHEDRVFNNLGGAFYNTAYFYSGRRVTHTWAFTLIHQGDEWENDRYDWAWEAGFHPPDDEANLQIRVE